MDSTATVEQLPAPDLTTKQDLASTQDLATAQDLEQDVEQDLLVEDVSIDGMCGVY